MAVHRDKTLAQLPKHLHKYLWKCFGICGSVLDLWKCFGFIEVFWFCGSVLDLWKCFGFVEVFFPYEPP